eukprot:SAG25_NODE_4920_length_731_cov_1.359177_1_plen_42_part_10
MSTCTRGNTFGLCMCVWLRNLNADCPKIATRSTAVPVLDRTA